MSNVYAVEDEDNLRPERQKGVPHQFELNRETRRMVCAKCGGIMNETPPNCTGKGVVF